MEQERDGLFYRSFRKIKKDEYGEARSGKKTGDSPFKEFLFIQNSMYLVVEWHDVQSGQTLQAQQI